MIINVSELRVKHWTTEDNRIVMDIQIKRDDDKYRASFYLHCQEHVERFIAQLLGEIDGIEGYAFDDLSRIMTNVSPYGFTLVNVTDSPPNNRVCYTFPGTDLAQTIRAMFDNGEEELTMTPSIIRGWKQFYGPRVDIVWHGEAEERFSASKLWTLRHWFDSKLDEQLDGLRNLATRYSDGNKVVLNVSLDTFGAEKTASFYWWIVAKSQQVYNGGLIWHKSNGDGAQLSEGRYSVHT